MTYQVAINILLSASLFGLIALSFRIPYLISGFFNLSHALAILLGGFFAHTLLDKVHLGFLPTVLIVVLLCSAISVLIHQITFERAIPLGAEKWHLLVMSIGVYVLGQNMIAIIFGNDILLTQFWHEVPKFLPANLYITNAQVMVIAGSLLSVITCGIYLNKTKLGREILYASENKELAELFGVNIKKVTLMSLGIGGGLAGFAGMLIYQDSGISPSIGFDWLLNGIVAMILGGLGGIRFLILGALLLASSQNIVAFYFDSRWMQSITFVILVGFLILKPFGLSDRKIKKIAL